MPIAALYDVHGNLPALEAALADVEATGAEVVVFGGDLVSGPLPRETLDVMHGLGGRARFIRGNADRELLELHEGQRETRPGGLNDRWVAEQLTEEQRRFLASLQETLVADVDGLGSVLFCHGSPRSDEEILTAATLDDRLREAVAGVRASIVVCGHTHMQFNRTIDGIRVLNAGSVGMPYGEAAAANWLLLGPGIEFRRSSYDLERAAEQIRASGYPLAREFAEENVLTTPSFQEATEAFERMARERA